MTDPAHRPRPRVAASAAAALLPALLLAALAAAPGCGSGAGDDETDRPRQAPVNVRVVEVRPHDLEESVTVSGPLLPVRGTTVSAEESGPVDAIPRDKGARVKAGDALVVIDRALLAAEREAAAAALERVEYDEERTRRLYEEKQVSRREMLELETGLAEARAAADAARIRWERAAVSAPFAGIVADRFVEPGELVAPGTPVARVVDPFTLKLRASVSEREVGWIREGADALVLLDGTGASTAGRVEWVAFEAAPSTGKFQVEIHVDNPDLEIRPGVVARARIRKRIHRDVLVIPRDAVVPQSEGDAVFVVEDGRARMRPVQLGPDEGMLVIVERGLAAGDQLLVRGQREVLDGSVVRVVERSEAADGSIDADPAVVRAGSPPGGMRAGTEEETPPAPAGGSAAVPGSAPR